MSVDFFMPPLFLPFVLLGLFDSVFLRAGMFFIHVLFCEPKRTSFGGRVHFLPVPSLEFRKVTLPVRRAQTHDRNVGRSALVLLALSPTLIGIFCLVSKVRKRLVA